MHNATIPANGVYRYLRLGAGALRYFHFCRMVRRYP